MNKERYRLRQLFRKCIRWGLRVGLAVAALLVIVWFAFPFPREDYERYDASRCITDRNGHLLRTTLNHAGQRCLPVALEDAGQWLPASLIVTEDKRFHQHGGLDLLALVRASWQMVRNLEVLSGASTLTTQTVSYTHLTLPTIYSV